MWMWPEDVAECDWLEGQGLLEAGGPLETWDVGRFRADVGPRDDVDAPRRSTWFWTRRPGVAWRAWVVWLVPSSGRGCDYLHG